MTQIKAKPMIANMPPKGKPGTIGATTPAKTSMAPNPTLKQAIMGRSKLPVRVGTKKTAILD